MGPPAIDAARVIADLRELDHETGGAGGARRLAWGPVWHRAREMTAATLSELGLETETDQAGNVWAYLRGDSEREVIVGSHLDSVPNGGWLDGALGVMAAIGVARAYLEAGARPGLTLAVVDWADEEGARFGRSLFGSAAAAGRLDVTAMSKLRDAEGRAPAEVLSSSGVDLDGAIACRERLDRAEACLELHIEQGPVLEGEDYGAAAVAGCAGVERQSFQFTGQASHAGTTPMGMRRDAGLAAAELALAVEEIAGSVGGVGTCGVLELRPGVVTAVPGEARLAVDLRHPGAEALASMLSATRAAAATAAEGHGCDLTEEPIWRTEPIAFDPELVARASARVAERGGRPESLTSGALHDAAEIARLIPAAMIFSASIGGISHAREEDTSEADLRLAIEAFGALAIETLGVAG